MSGSRNATNDPNAYREGTNGWHMSQPQSADVCYRCREFFSAGQMRYRVMEILPNSFGPALLCMDCFKSETDVSCLGEGVGGEPASRHVIECAGCGEQINTIRNPRYRQWNYCSNRCYQRVYRKRRRGRLNAIGWKRSVVEWKAGHWPRCKCCRKEFQPSRTDALYCSPSCRQWTHRRRVWASQRRNSAPRKRRRTLAKQ
jgi:hypothetical protein